MEQNEVTRWVMALARNPFVRAYTDARMRKAGPQYCDRCGQLLDDRCYLFVKTRLFFWTEASTCLCLQCHEQEMSRLHQSGVFPPRRNNLNELE